MMEEEEEEKQAQPTKKLSWAKFTEKTGTFITRRRFFRNMSVKAFHDMDTDGNGGVDENELYTGLLLIHLELAKYAGPSACTPPSREVVKSIFASMDKDDSSTINEHEFIDIMVILCSEIATRIVIQWLLTIFLVPQISRFILIALSKLWIWLTGIDWIEWLYSLLIYLYDQCPSKLEAGVDWLVDHIPMSVWQSTPVAIVSSLVSMVAVPMGIDFVQNFFMGVAVAEREKGTKDKEE